MLHILNNVKFMKNLFAIFGLVFLCLPTHANAYSDDSNKCFSLNQGCKYEVGEKKFKYVKGQKFLNQATRSTQVLAIVGGNNDSKKRLAKAKKMKEKINSFYVVKDQRARDLNQNYQLAQATPKRKSKIKTQGHYVGFDMVLNRLSFYQKFTFPIAGVNSERKVRPESRGYGGGFGFNYKYAFNFNKFFIAPGIFYERLNTRVQPSQKVYPFYEINRGELRVSDRYGFVTNFGYDINESLSPYVLLGYSAVRYTSKNGAGYTGENALESSLRTDTARSLLYGGGLNIKYNQEVSFNLEFNIQRFTALQNRIVTEPIFSGYISKYEANLKSIKFGAAYNF